ncbi:DUF5362 domain-containing protein [Ruminiclostridium herbifermentans]|uniref:DUF5362 domain-containing protein n=1 Tax=Ruminiclostridium herbifermentans TaxID=2488810 RepID=A0A4U7JKC5_9FIRM|nr:DUF5362 domain-containing protein [Ruminiclostridium herbifermentans]QNU65326.1 DUF5362 domain-containing protein [Ruminiclostridium herbifermentans]
MDNQFDSNNHMQDNINEGNINEQSLYNSSNPQNNMNQQYYYGANGIPQNNFYINSMIDSLSGWMKFMGIYTIIAGVISCLGIISAAIGVPMIFAGIALIKGSDYLKNYKLNSNPHVLNELFTSLNKYFKIQGILAIIGIVFLIICIVLSVILAGLTINTIQNYYNY